MNYEYHDEATGEDIELELELDFIAGSNDRDGDDPDEIHVISATTKDGKEFDINKLDQVHIAHQYMSYR